MTWWKRLIWVGCAFLALALYILPMLFQQLAIIYQFPKQWTIGLGLLLIFLALIVFVVVAKKTGILSQSGKIFQKGDGKRIALGLLGMLLISVLGTVLLRCFDGGVPKRRCNFIVHHAWSLSAYRRRNYFPWHHSSQNL